MTEGGNGERRQLLPDPMGLLHWSNVKDFMLWFGGHDLGWESQSIGPPVEPPATEAELRSALSEAYRALLHAEKDTDGSTWALVSHARDTVAATLDKGRDERNEQVAT